MSNTKNIILRLTALWALSESGLGGMMHAMKMPFTGLFLGGFAVVLITVMAYHSSHKWRTIIGATLMVMCVKFLAAPHTPFTAYIAVGFQGLLGALFYSFLPFHSITAMLFGMLALAESAVQRILMMTLVYGKNIWDAIDAFYNGIAKEFRLAAGHSLSYGLMAGYVGIYLLMGAIVGLWAARFSKNLLAHAANILPQYQVLKATNASINTKKKKKSWWVVLSIMIFIVTIFLFQGWNNKALYAILRTVAALLLLMYVVNPIIQWLMKKWVSKRSDQVTPVLELLPELRTYVYPAMQLAKQHYRGWAIYPAFVRHLIVLTLYDSTKEHV